jgi:hypothetical protein
MSAGSNGVNFTILKGQGSSTDAIVEVELSGSDGSSNTNNALSVKSKLVGFNGTTWDRIRAGLTVVTGAFTGSLNTMPYAIYNAAPTVRTEAYGGPFQADINGSIRERETYCPQYEDNANGVAAITFKPLAVSTYAPSVDTSAALEASSITKAAAGTFYSLSGRLDSTCPSGTYYIQVLNHASLPADGAVTRLCSAYKIIHVTGTDSIFNIVPPMGLYASTGIVICLSTAEFTKVIGGAYLAMDVIYI